MEYRNLGSTDLKVSELGLGLWPVMGVYGPVDDSPIIASIHRALDLGITLFDTAPAYGNGRAEEVLARGLGASRRETVVVTKCGVPWSEEKKDYVRNSNYQEITQSAEASLRRLSTDVIDLLLVHWPDPNTPFEEPMRAFADLKQAGKVRFVGVSNFSIDQIAQCLQSGPINAQQISYHMFNRASEPEMLSFCEEHGIGVMTYGTLAHGLLSGTLTADTKFAADDFRSRGNAFGLPIFREGNFQKNVAVVERLKPIARDRGKTVPQLALAWVLRKSAVSVALTGPRRPEEIEENVGGAGWKLTTEELTAIEEVLKGAAGTTREA